MIGEVTSQHPSATGERDRRPSASGEHFSRMQRRFAAAPSRWASALAWFSVGLGVTQLLAPRALAKLVGVRDRARTRTVMRALGARELMVGLGLLRARRTAPWLWSRVAGDVVDLGLLARLATAAPHPSRRNAGRVFNALLAVGGVTVLDVIASRRASRTERGALPAGGGGVVTIHSALTVGRPPSEVYAWWRNLHNLAAAMTNVESITVLDELRSLWKVRVAGKLVEWQAEITGSRPDHLIAWRTLQDADVVHTGNVRFVAAPGGRGTEIHVDVEVTPWGGRVGKAVAKLGRLIPQQQVTNDLRRVKQVLEVGEIIQSDASIHRGPHPGRPSSRNA
jgi:uncharacterized membrane protein